jgi:hypothetical protein
MPEVYYSVMSLSLRQNPHPEVAAKRPSKGMLQQARFIRRDASRLATLAPQREGILSERFLLNSSCSKVGADRDHQSFSRHVSMAVSRRH